MQSEAFMLHDNFTSWTESIVASPNKSTTGPLLLLLFSGSAPQRDKQG